MLRRFLEVHRDAAQAAAAEAEREGYWTAPYMARLYKWLDNILDDDLEQCKKCGLETDEIHLWLCRDCFEEMGMKVEFDPDWTPSS